MSRQQQFKNREEKILATAEQLLLEAGSGDITLDSLADQLDLAKGTLYKHFSSKDELYLRIIIRYEEQLRFKEQHPKMLQCTHQPCDTGMSAPPMGSSRNPSVAQ